ncbi:fungal-specific transcription factor domain-containing protein [Exophiala viscosa]|uniref:Fungal-specific transcription factor domain-containing protein n=1 Tax=Exophiala viscosa TaxID=2486360 RepID=A0AAN6IBQ4_9EURO|nr:fungal-specific transcription factor domain-containing protein [Exophiala viscosa]
MALTAKIPNEIPPARKYRSRKQKPCDHCRRRRVCCVRDAEGACALCSRRSIPCTFSSKPSPRKRQARSTAASTPAVVSVDAQSNDHDGGNKKSRARESTTPNASLDQKAGAEGKYIGLTGTDDVYFVVDRFQGLGNDPAREAYFRERSSSTQSGSSSASEDAARSVEAQWPLVRSIFVRNSHPAFPLLDAELAESDRQSRLLAVAIAIITKYTSPELLGIHSNVLIEELTSSMLLEARSPRLETVEAAILFTQKALRGRMSTSAPGLWAVIGCIIGMSHDLGLHVDCSTWNIPAAIKRRRRRIWWAAYFQDKWFAMALGRPSYLNDANTTTLMLTAADFEDCDPESRGDQPRRPELATGIHCFVAMAELAVILNEVLLNFFTIGSVVKLREVTGQHIIDIADRIEAKLDNWRAVYLDPILSQRFFPDVTGSLEIAYITAHVMLLRGIFPKLYRRNLSLDSHFDRAVEVTSRAISLVETLQINRLSAFWWACSGLNFALVGTFMASLKRLSTDSIRAKYWDEQLAYYRKLLAAHGTGFWPAKFAATALDLMAKNLTKTTGDAADDVSGSGGASGAASSSDAFVNGNGLIDAFASPETSWSGASYDFFPHNLTVLNEADFSTDWAAVGGAEGFLWQNMHLG